ncbi:MAG: hypothetical protein N2Z65_03475, partial [Clostridiales bacterium]|nr:hypothetical protein [Clostridiales bacterium]
MLRPLFFFTSVFAATVYLIQLPCSLIIRLCLILLFIIITSAILFYKNGKKGEFGILLSAVLFGSLWFIGYKTLVY